MMPCSPTWTTPAGLQGREGPGKAAKDLECPTHFSETLAGLLTIPSKLFVVLAVSSRGPTSLSPPLFLPQAARCQQESSKLVAVDGTHKAT